MQLIQKKTLYLSSEAAMCNYSVYVVYCNTNPTLIQCLWWINISRHFSVTLAEWKSVYFFPPLCECVCVCVCSCVCVWCLMEAERVSSPPVSDPVPGPGVTLHLPGAPTCRDSIHLNTLTHTHTHAQAHAHWTFLHSKWVPMGLRVSCQDLLLLRDWSWGKAVTHTLLHSLGLVTLLVRMMALSCLLSTSSTESVCVWWTK